MEFKKLEEINTRLKTTDIKGKNYVEVNQRILAFRELFEEGSILTEIVELKDGICTMKSTILGNDGKILSIGHAQEKEGSTFINKTSFIENCETSAIGRALGTLGIGATTSIASYEEVANAISNQQPKDRKLNDEEAQSIYRILKTKFTDDQIGDTLMKKYGIGTVNELKASQYAEILRNMNKEV